MRSNSLYAQTPRRSALRRRLEQELRTDAELDAFCLDHFPGTYRLFAQGMDRQQKQSLLLSREDLRQIAGQLAVERDAATAGEEPPGPPSGSSRRVGLFLLVLAVVLGAALWSAALWSAARKTEPPREDADAVLRSTPPGAEIWDLRTGRLLGTSPWVVDPGVLPRVVCLRRPGFHDEVLTLAPSQLRPRAIPLRPVNTSVPEVCDVPIPILP